MKRQVTTLIDPSLLLNFCDIQVL